MTLVSTFVFIASVALWVSVFASIMRTWDAWHFAERRRVEANRLLMLTMITGIVLAICLRIDITAPLYAAAWVLALRLLFFIGLRMLLKLGYQARNTGGD